MGQRWKVAISNTAALPETTHPEGRATWQLEAPGNLPIGASARREPTVPDGCVWQGRVRRPVERDGPELSPVAGWLSAHIATTVPDQVLTNL